MKILVSIIGKKRFPVECPQACIEIYTPVCGSNMKTYSNDCKLHSEACKTNPDLQKIHDGECIGK